MASLSSAVASKYSPVTGLITDNNYNQYTHAAGFAGNGQKGAAPAFTNPNSPPPPGPDGAPPSAAGSITGVGAFTPDWASLIKNDPGLLDAQSALMGGSVADLAGRNAAIQRALVDFGNAPDLASLAKSLGMTEADLQNAVGPDVQQLAKENTQAGLSTEARLSQANQDAIRQIRAELNRRGMLNSGETANALDRQNTSFRQADYDANQKLIDYLNQYQQGYVTAQQTKAQQLATAYSSAADRQYSSNQGSSGFTASFDHVDTGGAPVYKGPDGRLYNSDGSPYSAPQAPQPAAAAAPAAPAIPGVRLNPSAGRSVMA